MQTFNLLGPIEITDQRGRPVGLTRRKQRVLLALLLLRSETSVAVGEVVDVLWGERPPASARANLYSYVSDLRSALAVAAPDAGVRPASTPHGYRLDLCAGEYDVELFDLLAGSGRRALRDGCPAAADDQLTRALGLWRGPALDGLEDHPFVAPHVGRLNHARLAALEDQVEARLELGRHVELSLELMSTVELHPTCERLWRQFMVALYRSGRRTDALRAYLRLDTLLHREIGVGPSLPTRRLHQAIVRDDADRLGLPRAMLTVGA